MKDYQIRRAEERDLPAIAGVYAVAKAFMRASGNPTQWSGGYPQEALLREDMKKGALYVVMQGDHIHGVFYFAVEADPTYQVIEEGAWLCDEPYGVIHRIAADGSGGIFPAALRFASGRISHLRIDTHHDNKPMQHVVEKHGFHRCGIIHIADGSPRIAYEKV